MVNKTKKTALPGSRKNLHMMDPDDITLIGLDTDDGAEHALYDPRVLNEPPEYMIKSVLKHGIRQNVTVRKVIVDDQERYELVYGRKRVRAAREANKRLKDEGSDFRVKIPTTLEKADDQTLFSFLVIENELREETNVLQKAELAERMRRLGADQEDIADAFGVTGQTIKIWESISSLCKQVKTAIVNGEISPSAAAQLADYTAQEQVKQLKTLKKESGSNKVTAKRVRRVVNSNKPQALGKRQLRRLLALGEAPDTLSEDFMYGVMWAIGDLETEKVAGLEDLVKKAERK